MISPSQKEQFDMKTMKNIEIKLRDNNEEEDINIETFEDIKKLLTKKIKKLKSNIESKDNDKKETFQGLDELYNKSSVSSSLNSSPIN